MERTDIQSHAEWAGSAVCSHGAQLRRDHHSVHGPHTLGHPAPGPAADTLHPEDVGDPAQASGYAKAVCKGQSSPLSGDHASLQRSGGEPYWVSGANGDPVPYLDRPLYGDCPGASHQPGISGRPRQPSLLMDTCGARGGAPEQQVPVSGPDATRWIPYGCAGGRVHVGHAEDEHATGRRPAPELHQPDDALDDAGHVWFLYNHLAQWTTALLVRIQPHWHSYSVLCNGLGRPYSFPGETRGGGCGRRRDPG